MRQINRIILSLMLAAVCSNAFAEKAFTGNVQVSGKSAKLGYLIASHGKSNAGDPLTVLIFTEKDTSGEKDAANDAGLFGHFGDAMVIRLLKSDAGWKVLGSNLIVVNSRAVPPD